MKIEKIIPIEIHPADIRDKLYTARENVHNIRRHKCSVINQKNYFEQTRDEKIRLDAEILFLDFRLQQAKVKSKYLNEVHKQSWGTYSEGENVFSGISANPKIMGKYENILEKNRYEIRF